MKKLTENMMVQMEDGSEMSLADLGAKIEKDQDDRLKSISENLPEHPAPGPVIEIEGTRYSLERERDGAGDSGPMLTPFDWDTRKAVGKNGTIQIGLGVKCGSLMARTFGSDWWLTTPVTEIIAQGKNDDGEGSWVQFRTGNSVYTVRGF